MSFKDKILASLSELSVTPDSIAEQLSVAIRGETITERYGKDGNLSGRTVKRTPEDALKGAMLYDAIHGGQLGLAPKVSNFRKPTEIAHKRMSIDTRIIVTGDDDLEDVEHND